MRFFTSVRPETKSQSLPPGAEHFSATEQRGNRAKKLFPDRQSGTTRQEEAKMTAEKIHPRAPGLLFLALLLLLSLPAPALHAGGPLVSGQYLNSAGHDIQLRLTVASPTPGTLIVIQNLPAGTVIESASPAFHQYDAGKGEVKWLLTQVSPGRYLLSLRLSTPLASGGISGEIRYKDPASGRMTNLPIRP